MKRTIFLIALLASVFALQANEFEVPKYSAFSGRHFYVGFMQNEIELSWQNDDVQLRIFITAVLPTTYEVKIPGYQTMVGELKANDIKEITVQFPLEVRDSEVAQNKAVEISSELPISVYCFSSKLTTSESYSAIPISRWGKEYVVMSYPNDQYDDTLRANLSDDERFTPRSSQFMVMAAYDNTVISFSPKARTKGGKNPGLMHNVVLNRGEVYLVQSSPSPRGTGDLTGTIVRGDKPFGLLTGHVRSAVPQTNAYPYDSKDHLVEMLPPTDTWGKFYCSTPFGVNIRGDLFRLAGIHPGTIVTYEKENGEQKELYLNNPGDWVEINDIAHAAVWRGNKPFQIVQYMRHTGEYGDSKEYDPSIVVIPPVEQFVQDIIFLTPRNFQVQDQYREHRVSIIADAPALVDLSLDGELARNKADFYSNPIEGTSFYWASIGLREGRHNLRATKGKFSGVLYGFGFHDSYAMALGNSLTNPFRYDSLPPTLVVNERCGFINGFVHDIHDTNSSGIDFGWVVKYKTHNYSWNLPLISDTATFVSFSAQPVDIHSDGNFEIEFYDKNSNAVRYSHQYRGIKINTPKEMLYPNLSWSAQECKEFKVFNFGNRVMRLDSVVIINDRRLKFSSNKPIPAVLNPKDTITFTLCFDPKGDSTTLYTNMMFFFDCDYSMKMTVKGNVKAPKIGIAGYDFGDVVVGETKCGTIKIENLGNTDLIIDKLLLDTLFFQYEINDHLTLPKTLKQGDSLVLNVCFTPTDTVEYKVNISAANDYDLLNSAIIIGHGVAPAFESILIDWGKRRIGTSSDTLMYFENLGSYPGLIKFKSLDIGEHHFENVDMLKNINTILQPKESIPLNLSYNPVSTDIYEVNATFETDWKLHKKIAVHLRGEGTIPNIETFDFRFDTTRIFIDIDSTMIAVLAGGNERLTIDEIRPIGGDYESFDLNLAVYENMKLISGNSLVVPIAFTPKRVGEHKLHLEVINDAMPNYERRRDTITISGFALPADTIDYDLQLVLPELFACIPEDGYFEITNKGNININLQKIDISRIPDNYSADFKQDVYSLLPIVIEPSKTHRFDMNFYAERNQGGMLVFDLQFNDSINRRVEYSVIPVVMKLEVASNDDLEAVPGDTMSLNLSGRFPIGVFPNVDVLFEILIDNHFVELLSKTGTFILKNSKENINLPVEFLQKSNKIELKLGTDSLKISEETEWEVQLVFMALLHDKSATDLTFSAISNRCFEPGEKIIPIKIIDICNFPLRPIKLISNLPYFNIAPNPIVEKIRVEVFLPEDDEISFTIIDAMGKTIEIERFMKLSKGKHFIEYSSDGLSSGVYNLIMTSKQINGNNIFIITK